VTLLASPMLKHPGHPDQKVHAGKHGGGDFAEWGDRAAEIQAFAKNGPTVDELKSSQHWGERIWLMQQVFGVTVHATGKDGKPVTLRTEVTGADSEHVSGAVLNQDGTKVGYFKRKLGYDKDGNPTYVYHERFEIDEEYQGLGLGSAMNRQAENWYISQGFRNVQLQAGLDMGGYAWARAGFDFNPPDDQWIMDREIRRLVPPLIESLRQAQFSPVDTMHTRRDVLVQQLQDIHDRWTKAFDADAGQRKDFPTAREIVSIGLVPFFHDKNVGSHLGWYLVSQTVWDGIKFLTPTGLPQSEVAKSVLVAVPVTKHLPGKHDQKTHAHGGGSGDFAEWGDRAAELREAAATGPTKEQLKDFGSLTADERKSLMGEVFNFDHETPQGTLRSVVSSTSYTSIDGSIRVHGEIHLGEHQVGTWTQTLFPNEDRVSHTEFNVSMNFRRLGMASTFLRKAENYYITHGLTRYTVTAGNGGATAWALRGFMWKAMPVGMDKKLKALIEQSPDKSLSSKAEDLLKRFKSNNDLPTPTELMSLGTLPGPHGDYSVGRWLMANNYWSGEKWLTPNGLPPVSKSVFVAVPFLKHLPGKHNQKDHAGKGGGGGVDGLAPAGMEKEFDGVVHSTYQFADDLLQGNPLGLLAMYESRTMPPEFQAFADKLVQHGKDEGLSDEETQFFMLAQLKRAGDVRAHERELGELSKEKMDGLVGMIERVRSEGEVCVAIDPYSLEAMLDMDEPRFLSQFESASSNGAYAPDARVVGESRILGLPMRTPASERPIYGFVAHQPSWEDEFGDGDGAVTSESLDQYGEFRVVLKPSVKARTTMCVGDSLNTGALPIPMEGEVAPRRAAYATTARDVMMFPPPTTKTSAVVAGAGAVQERDYFEAQIHGGVKLSDIARVEWASSRSYGDGEDAAAALRARGIQVVEY